MPEEMGDPAIQAEPNAGDGTEQRKFAGKYETIEQLEEGVRSARKTLNLDSSVQLIGEGGMYSDVHAMEKGYVDYDKIINSSRPEPTEPTQPEPSGEEQPPITPQIKKQDPVQEAKVLKNIPQILESAGVEQNDIVTQWTENGGSLNDETYQKFESQGYGRDAVDTVISGTVAQAQANVNAMNQVAGSKENVDQLFEFAGTLPADRINNLNERLQSGKRHLIQGAMREIKGEFEAAGRQFGQAPATNSNPLVNGSSTPPSTTTGYATFGEYEAALRKTYDGSITESEKKRLDNTDMSVIMTGSRSGS